MCIFEIIAKRNFEGLKRIVEENPQSINIKNEWKRSPLDVAIICGNLQMAKFLFEKDGRPNLETYCDGKWTPIHSAACNNGDISTLRWVFEKGILPPSVLNTRSCPEEWTPLDCVIAYGKPEIAQFLFEKGARPDLEIYCDEKFTTPVHNAARNGKTATLKWVFENGILPLTVLNVEDFYHWTPLDLAIGKNERETAALLRRLLYVEPVFLAMQRAKRDRRCVLRRLPDELLDWVVDEVAARHHLEVVW